jgi:hypothetical protein
MIELIQLCEQRRRECLPINDLAVFRLQEPSFNFGAYFYARLVGHPFRRSPNDGSKFLALVKKLLKISVNRNTFRPRP